MEYIYDFSNHPTSYIFTYPDRRGGFVSEAVIHLFNGRMLANHCEFGGQPTREGVHRIQLESLLRAKFPNCTEDEWDAIKYDFGIGDGVRYHYRTTEEDPAIVKVESQALDDGLNQLATDLRNGDDDVKIDVAETPAVLFAGGYYARQLTDAEVAKIISGTHAL